MQSIYGDQFKQLLSHATHRGAVVATAVIRRTHTRGIDVQAVHIVTTVPSRRPEVAERPLTERGAIVEDA